MENDILDSSVKDSGGSGKTLVFLHGFCESKEIWREFTEPLQQEYRVVLLDLPGHGQNTAFRENLSLENTADYVQKVLQVLNIHKCILVGHSMGGYTAMAFAEKYPELLSGVVMFHSSALPDAEDKKQNRNKTIEFIQKHGVDKFMDSFVAPLFIEANRNTHVAAIHKLTAIGKQASPEALIGAVAAMRDRPDRTHVLRAANFPFLFIAGKEDQAVTLEQTLQQCHLPKLSYTLFLDQTGHMGMFERPTETLAAIRSFAQVV